ncbi:UNVERIFIED_CONTAM: hypothetical protein RMT77_016617 [Armadillidium vulgare]
MRLLMLILTLGFYVGLIKMELALKVSNTFPSYFQECVLGEFEMTKENFFSGCLAMCKQKNGCQLACYSGKKCTLLSAIVSTYYLGTAGETMFGGKCQSLWAEVKDVIHRANISASSELLGKYGRYYAAYAVSGFDCPKAISSGKVFHTENHNAAWFLADLNESLLVKRVIIHTRGNTASNFASVEVRVGDIPNDEDLKLNTRLMFYEGTAKGNDIIIFEGDKSLQGKYVIIQKTVDGSFAFSQVKIIVE